MMYLLIKYEYPFRGTTVVRIFLRFSACSLVIPINLSGLFPFLLTEDNTQVGFNSKDLFFVFWLTRVLLCGLSRGAYGVKMTAVLKWLIPTISFYKQTAACSIVLRFIREDFQFFLILSSCKHWTSFLLWLYWAVFTLEHLKYNNLLYSVLMKKIQKLLLSWGLSKVQIK